MPRSLATLLLVLLLAAAACQTDPDVSDSTDEDPAAGEPGADGPGPAGLDEGVAASVNGADIATGEIDDRLAAAREDPEFAPMFEGEQGELFVAQFRAQTLSVLVQTRIVLDGAERLDASPTDEDVEQTRADFYEQFGGEEQFEEAVADSGMSSEALDEQIRSVAALDAVGRLLVERGEVPDPPAGVEGADPQELALQQWLGEQVAEAEVVVHPAFGSWDPQSGQVVPEQVPPPAAGPSPDD